MAERTKHATVGTSASTVTIGTDIHAAQVYEVVSIDGAGTVSWRLDGTTAVASADGCDTLPAVAGAASSQKRNQSNTISLIASANTAVIVRAVN